MERWSGKVAIVTGASSGIGAAIAEKLVKTGMQVVGLARRAERIEEAAKLLHGHPGKLHAFKTDMTNEQDILQAFKWTIENLGPIHVLINNAAVVKENTMMSGETKKWQDMLNTNVIGLCIATREAVQDMIKNEVDGHIVHINSVAGHYVMYRGNIYSATKFAVTNLAEVLRNELRDAKTGIKVTNVSPGLVDTEMLRRDGEMLEAWKPLPKLGSDDVADAVLYTLSTPPQVQVHEIIIRPLGEAL